METVGMAALLVLVLGWPLLALAAALPHSPQEVLPLDRLGEREPTCDQLRAMWLFSKRQSRAAQITNEIPTYRDAFAYTWESAMGGRGGQGQSGDDPPGAPPGGAGAAPGRGGGGGPPAQGQLQAALRPRAQRPSLLSRPGHGVRQQQQAQRGRRGRDRSRGRSLARPGGGQALVTVAGLAGDSRTSTIAALAVAEALAEALAEAFRRERGRCPRQVS
ncbi:hypothetical protein FOCC_FOCC005223 [Frankliniella occidentalis]|nr:hypothetical protein FOCC_FOCC005223 [Frankliniella occidentalis]